MRSPRRKPLSTSAAHVSRPQIPSARSPRASWNAETAANVPLSNRPGFVRRHVEAQRTEALLEIPDRLTAAARPEHGRIAQAMYSARSWRS